MLATDDLLAVLCDFLHAIDDDGQLQLEGDDVAHTLAGDKLALRVLLGHRVLVELQRQRMRLALVMSLKSDAELDTLVRGALDAHYFGVSSAFLRSRLTA